MSYLQILIALFVLFVLFRVLYKYTKRDISFKEWLGWTVFWIVVGVAAVLPKSTDLLAQNIGLETGRGVDLAVYMAIPVLFYIIFRLMSKIDTLQEDLTKVVRHIGMKTTDEPDNE